MVIRVTVRGKEIKMTRKEYLRRYGGKNKTEYYNDKMQRGKNTENNNK